MYLHALGKQVCSRLVADLIEQRENAARRAGHGFLPFHQLFDHFLGRRHTLFFLDRRQTGIDRISTGCRKTQGTNTFGNGVHGQGQFVILLFKHQVQCAKGRARHVPVEVMGLQIKYISIRQEPRQSIDNGLAVFFADTDINSHAIPLSMMFDDQAGTPHCTKTCHWLQCCTCDTALQAPTVLARSKRHTVCR
ncbi:hypothetical protein D3C76_1120080 [compost metagenome]